MATVRTHYKSRSALKKRLEGLLCDPLKGEVTYFLTYYHDVHNAYGRATVKLGRTELVAFSWNEMYAQERELARLCRERGDVSLEEVERKWMTERLLCEAGAQPEWLRQFLRLRCEAEGIKSA